MERHLVLLSSATDTVAQVKGALEPLKYKITVKSGLSSGLKAMQGDELVLLDLPDSIAALKEIKSYCPESTVLVSAGRKDVGQAMSEGAYLCLDRPLELNAVKAAVRNASDSIVLKSELRQLKKFPVPELILGSGEKMRKVLDRTNSLASRKIPILIKGERGSGRALIAEAMHYSSSRCLGPLVQMTFHPESFEEAFFGSASERGRALAADGGTLFIRNLTSINTKLADRLSHFIETGIVEQADGQMVHVDVRVMASTDGLDKAEPAYKCFTRPVVLPPLRERREDIAPLVNHFLVEATQFCESDAKEISADAMKLLEAHRWPGNISELKSTVRRACLLSRGCVIEPGHITHDDGTTYSSIKDFLDAKLSRFVKDMVKLERSGLHESVMSEVEKSLIEIVLEETGGNQLRTASTLGITRTTLRNKIKLYGIKLASTSPRRK